LAKQDEISSTEKLLELIRADAPQDPPAAEPKQPKTRPRGSAFVRGSMSFRKKIAIGVDLGPNDLKLVKVNRISENKHEVLAFERVALDPAYPKDGPVFHKFLKSTIGRFCGSLKAPEIWCTMSSARVDLRLIRIPKVASKQIATSVFWSFQKESPFDEKEKIFDFELLGDVDDKGVTKTEVMAYSVPLQEVKDLKDQFAKAGFPLTGISIVPFAYQALLRAGRIEPNEGNVASLYIGRDWSRIDIFSKGTLMLSRGIKAGVKTMIEAIRKEIEGGRRELTLAPASPEGSRVRIVKRKLEVDLDQA
jgi:Tfp pilus assembly PilM family ATPase